MAGSTSTPLVEAPPAKFRNLRVVLIGGSSHAGKSTLAQALASQLGWSYRSTDKLAKHPGRPWRTPPKTVSEHVADHYLSLSEDQLITDVLRHYRNNVWPLVEGIVTTHATDTVSDRLVMEGSALLPERAATLGYENVAALWLTADEDLFARRIYQESEYETRSTVERTLIDRFLRRTVNFNALTVAEVRRLGLIEITVGDAATDDELLSTCLAKLKIVDDRAGLTARA